MKLKNNKDFFGRQFDIPKFSKINNIVNTLSLTEKVIFGFLIFVMGLSTITMLYKINNTYLINIPTKGGSLTEGVLGSPRFINPLLAISNADRDVTILVYSGLLKAFPNGELVPDLAKEYSISEDGLVYSFILKDDIFFHDNQPITTKDIEFTINASKDSTIKSPKRANWEGVDVQIINDKQIDFILKNPYSPFLENTTIGILPEHIWGDIESEQFAFSLFNIEAIGSGPYKITNISRNSSGILEKYELKPFSKYALGEPFISHLTLNFYPNEEKLINAYKRGSIESINTITPEIAKEFEEKGERIERIALPRIFAIFFNQNQNSIFTNIEIRKALDKALDKERIVSEILSGFGRVINGPIPLASKYYIKINDEEPRGTEEAIAMLERNNWVINEETGIREKTIKKVTTPLIFTLATSDAPELKMAAEIIKEEWSKIGVEVILKIFDIGDLNQNVIRPREYDALLFGEVIGRDMDLFAFWHSSQRNDPGLNIAMYANIAVDKLLEKVRTSNLEEDRIDDYDKFQKEIQEDVPVVFIYSPDFIYLIPEKINNLSLGQITTSSERFLSIHEWNIETDTVWKIFSK